MDNIYELIAKLRKARRQHTITSGAQALFYELVAINNEERWVMIFKCKAGELCSALQCTEKTLGGWRKELIAAGLLGYKSGKHVHAPSDYSLDGSSYGSSDGVIDGSSYGGNNYHREEHPSGVKTPDLLIHKKKYKRKKTLKEEVVLARSAEIETAINVFCGPENSAEKEKNIAPKKERLLPEVAEAIKKIGETANWRNVLNKHIIPDDMKAMWDRLPGIDQEVYLQQRADLFEEFYAYKEDNYKAQGLPTWSRMAENFYHWVEIQKNKQLTKLKGALNGKSTTTNGNTITGVAGIRQRNEDKRAELRNLKAGSTEFLRRADH